MVWQYFSFSSTFRKSFFEKLSVYDFLLRKISRMGVVRKESLPKYGVCQSRNIEKLLQEGLLECSEKSSFFPDDFQEISLTPEANMKLFLTDYSQEVKSFKQLLASKGYNVVLFPLFLKSQDFSKRAEEILTIENFVTYCSTSNRSMFKDSFNEREMLKDFSLKNVIPSFGK